ncbi:ionotropic receptor 25a-like [Prorops nasuta]|uniref:ionotropic receptor 25a-like n=1 Tax=Prorops nasuta TaxID=863751 RepID=UPI0034CDB0D8
MILSPLWASTEKAKVVDFTNVYYETSGLSILALKEKRVPSLFRFLEILDNNVLLTISIAFMTTACMIWIFERWSPKSYLNNPELYKEEHGTRIFDLRESFWFTITAMTPEGGGEIPRNLSGKLTAATWWLFGFVIIAAYTANLAAYQTLARLEKRVENFDDLIHQYKLGYSVLENSSAHRYFQLKANAETILYRVWRDLSLNESLSAFERSRFTVWDYPIDDKYIKILQSMKEVKFVGSNEEALARIRKEEGRAEDFALITESPYVKYLTLRECDLKEIGQTFAQRPLQFALKKGSPLLRRINEALRIMIRRREIEALEKKWWRSKPLRKKCRPAPDINDGMDVTETGGIFAIILIGIIGSVITLCIEYWWFVCRAEHSASKNPFFEDAQVETIEKQEETKTLRKRHTYKSTS